MRERTGTVYGLLQPGQNWASAWMEMMVSPLSGGRPSGLLPQEVKGEEKLEVFSTISGNSHHNAPPLHFLLFL